MITDFLRRARVGTALVLTLASLQAAGASTFYVDAVRGNDAYDGLSDLYLGGTRGPKKTLQAGLDLATATLVETAEGDTVYMAEGVYDAGADSTSAFRGALKNGTRLIGVGDRDKILICGKIGESGTHGTGGDTLRGLKLGKWNLVQNLTVCNCRATANGGAVSSGTDSFFMACAFTNNATTGRGGVASGGTYIRCYFQNNYSSIGACLNGGKAFNCVFNQDTSDPLVASTLYAVYQATCYNCTFVGDSKGLRGNGGNDYNCLILTVCGGGNPGESHHYSYVVGEHGDDIFDEHSVAGLSPDDLQFEEGSYLPKAGYNRGIDNGSTDAYNSAFPTSDLVKDQKNLDFYGNPRIVGTAIDCGACELDTTIRTVSIADASEGLQLSGIGRGLTRVLHGSPVTFTVARSSTGSKICAGINVNDEFMSFDEQDAYMFTVSSDDASSVSLTIVAVYQDFTAWYVDAVNGDDGNDGRSISTQRRTLASVLGDSRLSNGDRVYVREGVYNEGVMKYANSVTSNRVDVIANVGVIATGARDRTIIEGYIPETMGDTTAIRCAHLAAGAYLKGFTLRNGSTAISPGTGTKQGDVGGGAYGSGAVIDCIITNCYAVRGGGTADITLIRSQIVNCGTIRGTNSEGGTASATADVIYGGSAYDSYLSGGISLNLKIAVNSTFEMSNGCWSTTTDEELYGTFYNCYATKFNSHSKLWNCIVNNTRYDTVIDVTNNLFESTFAIDPSTKRPVSSTTIAVDAGDRAHYVYPAAFLAERGKDVQGGSRIYNAAIDIGCGEYDWRPEFTSEIGTVTVTEASADVVRASRGLTLVDGCSAKMEWVFTSASRAVFMAPVSGGGTLLVKVNGDIVTPSAGGRYEFQANPGVMTFEFRFAGSGSAKVSSFAVSGRGMAVLYR